MKAINMKSINAGLLVTLALPILAIVASLHVAAVAFLHGDATLPDDYHWEGMKLDHDFSSAQRAAALDVKAALQVLPASRTCRVTLQLTGTPPEGLSLTLTHATQPSLDWRTHLRRLRHPKDAYEGFCIEQPAGHWHVELADAAGSWSVREDIRGALDGTIMSARPQP